MYILVCENEVIGLYTSHTDAHVVANDYLSDHMNTTIQVYYAQPNSNVVSLWDTI